MTKEFSAMQSGLKDAFNKVRNELEDHLETINQNTTEIQSLYEVLMALEQRLDKLEERIDDVQVNAPTDVVVQPLTYREQEVFLVIYTSNNPISIPTLSQTLGFTEEMVNHYVTNIVAKGVPLLRQRIGEIDYFSLELRFKDRQAKENVVHIDEHVSRQLLSENIIS